MRLLLDTHILLWATFQPEKLPSKMKEAIADTNNIICISVASLWEIAIKQTIGRLSLPTTFFDTVLNEGGFTLLPLHSSHISSYLTLPLYHRDPFDRMLVAQALAEELTFVTCDEAIRQYAIKLL